MKRQKKKQPSYVDVTLTVPYQTQLGYERWARAWGVPVDVLVDCLIRHELKMHKLGRR
jgi:hypothetical protein